MKKIVAFLLAAALMLSLAVPVLAGGNQKAKAGKLDWTVAVVDRMEDKNDTSGNIADDYNQKIEAKGPVEKRYHQDGPSAVEFVKIPDQDERIQNYYIFYPEEMTKNQKKYPVIVLVNGTGITARKYLAIFRHLASWGFLVVGCDDPTSWDGWSGAQCLDFVLSQNKNRNSIFYDRADTDHIGIDGHSQGGVAAINAAANYSNSRYYKAVVSESCVSRDISNGLEWPYDVSKIKTPILFFGGTGASDAEIICPLKDMKANFNAVNSGKLTAMARVVGAEHGNVLTNVEGYRTAWFCYLLKGDQYAGKAFTGGSPELLFNPNFSDGAIK